MPELPEVETIRRDLEQRLLHKTFLHIQVPDPFVLRSPLKEFKFGLIKNTITAVIRRGKLLLFQLSNGQYLSVHLMMTGQLVVNGEVDRHTRVIFELSDQKKLLYNDQRRFGQLKVVRDLSEINYLNILGPEPLSKEFNARHLFDQTRTIKRPIKTLLLDHTFVAGLGNIYVCEILFRCGIDPQKQACKLNLKQAESIHGQTVKILNLAIKHRGSSMRNYRDASGQKGEFKKLIRVYAKEGEPCPSCKKPIQRIIQAGRSTFFCSQCQK